MSPRVVLCVAAALLAAGCTTSGPNDADDAPHGTPTPPGGRTAVEPAPPGERREDNVSDLDRPGEYVVLARRTPHTDAAWSAPSWTEGMWWRYRHELAGAPGCTPATRDRVVGSDVRMDHAVYLVETDEYDCEEEQAGTKERAFLASELSEMDADGYVEPSHLFPFEDGKRWRYLRAGDVLVDAELSHVARFAHNGSEVEAWRIELRFQGENVTVLEWLGVEAKNVLRRELWSDEAGGRVYAVDLSGHGGLRTHAHTRSRGRSAPS